MPPALAKAACELRVHRHGVAADFGRRRLLLDFRWRARGRPRRGGTSASRCNCCTGWRADNPRAAPGSKWFLVTKYEPAHGPSVRRQRAILWKDKHRRVAELPCQPRVTPAATLGHHLKGELVADVHPYVIVGAPVGWNLAGGILQQQRQARSCLRRFADFARARPVVA